MVYRGHARVIDESYQDYDFFEWLKVEVRQHHEHVGLINRLIRVPRVLKLYAYDRLPKRKIRFSRHNVFLRDRHTCQYCGEAFPKKELNIDHIIPRSKGGKTTWDNVVCCCVDCNHRKGGHLPDEIGMRLLRLPSQPHWVPYFDKLGHPVHFQEWKPFLPIATSG